MCAHVTRRLKSGEAVFRVHAYKSAVFVGEAFLQVATHAGKLGTTRRMPGAWQAGASCRTLQPISVPMMIIPD